MEGYLNRAGRGIYSASVHRGTAGVIAPLRCMVLLMQNEFCAPMGKAACSLIGRREVMEARELERCGPRTNPHLFGLIRAKRERHWKPSETELKQGFLGWQQRGYLPHFDAPDVR